jgi:hypothetical protein
MEKPRLSLFDSYAFCRYAMLLLELIGWNAWINRNLVLIACIMYRLGHAIDICRWFLWRLGTIWFMPGPKARLAGYFLSQFGVV